MDALYEQRDEEFGKFIKWFQFVLSLPSGEEKLHIVIASNSNIETKAKFMQDIRCELDSHVYGMKNCFVLTFSYFFEDIDFKMTISLDDQIWTRDGREILIM